MPRQDILHLDDELCQWFRNAPRLYEPKSMVVNAKSVGSHAASVLWSIVWCGIPTDAFNAKPVNAELRHYLKRVARKSKGFSRRLNALARNIRLFVYCYNHPHLAKQLFPAYSLHLVDVLSLPV